MSAKLYGVGVGPGAPDLLTLRAVRILREARVLIIPRSSDKTESIAWKIARDEIGEIPGQERLILNFPMTKDPSVLRPAWDRAFSEIGNRIRNGKSVAFLTEGDPFLYSTFIYLFNEAKTRWPDLPVEVVPGVSSVTAAAAVAGIPLADGEETVAILPSNYSMERVEEALDRFDTVVLMKVGSVMPETRHLLEEKGLLQNSVYVAKCEMEGQRIERDLSVLRDKKCDYFSLALVVKRERSGVLMGARGKIVPSSRGGVPNPRAGSR